MFHQSDISVLFSQFHSKVCCLIFLSCIYKMLFFGVEQNIFMSSKPTRQLYFCKAVFIHIIGDIFSSVLKFQFFHVFILFSALFSFYKFLLNTTKNGQLITIRHHIQTISARYICFCMLCSLTDSQYTNCNKALHLAYSCYDVHNIHFSSTNITCISCSIQKKMFRMLA